MACATIPDIQVNAVGKQFLLRSSVGEELLAALYIQWKQDGTFPVFFHEHPGMSLSGFLEWHRTPGMEYLGCFLKDVESGCVELAGIGYINARKRSGDEYTAEVGVGFLRRFQKAKYTIPFTEQLLDYCFLSRNLQAIHGISPCPNRAIHVFARRMGFQAFGPIPFFSVFRGHLEDSYLYAMRASDWILGKGGRP